LTASRTTLKLRLRGTLIDVRLRGKDGESDVIHANIGPGYILCESLTDLPRLEARGISDVDGGDVIDGDIGNVGKRGLILAKRADTHAVALVANTTTLKKDVVRAGLHRNSLITIEDNTVEDLQVGTSYVEAASIEGESIGG